MSYFAKFPSELYNGKVLRNIILHADIVREVFDRFDIYYPYVIEEWERPDTIAADYYGDSKYFWVVLMSNDIHNVYEEWYKNDSAFNAWITKKYGKNVYDLMSEVKEYRKTTESDTVIRILPETFDKLDAVEKSFFEPITVYDYEKEINEQKKHIRLLDNEYLPQIRKELSVIFHA